MNSEATRLMPGRGFASRKDGVTLIEAVVVIVIMVVLIAIGVPTFQGILAASKDSNAVSSAQAINQAQQTYKMRVTAAAANWSAASGNDAKYALILPYVSFNSSYPTIEAYQPNGYTFTLGSTLDTKVAITNATGGTVSY